jgi:aspartyl-tRNA(Asn)/glutamyl-tRNA(Gln) amidotransferase subunit C
MAAKERKVDEAQVRHIAMLSRLKPSDDEVALFSEQLSAIVDYVEKLNEVNTDDVEPTAHAIPVENVFRADEVRPSISSDEALANAPQRDGDFFAVPKVLDQGSGA